MCVFYQFAVFLSIILILEIAAVITIFVLRSQVLVRSCLLNISIFLIFGVKAIV